MAAGVHIEIDRSFSRLSWMEVEEEEDGDGKDRRICKGALLNFITTKWTIELQTCDKMQAPGQYLWCHVRMMRWSEIGAIRGKDFFSNLFLFSSPQLSQIEFRFNRMRSSSGCDSDLSSVRDTAPI